MNLDGKTEEVIAKYDLQRWFRNLPCDRPYARDIITHLCETRTRLDSVLEIGCGIGQNLVALWENGFRWLGGVEVDPDTYLGACELCDALQVHAKIILADGRDSPLNMNSWDVILPLNWTYQKDVDIPGLMKRWADALRPGGELIIDLIDSAWPRNDAPEYVQRFGDTEARVMALQAGLDVLKVKDYAPRRVYYCRKTGG